jgi:acyl transferase domain-containing protein
LKEVSFSSQLSGDAFYARDHKVNDQMIFPGSGFLEIACVSGAIAGARKVRRIKDVVWIQPLVFRNESQTIQISLKPADESAQYAITSYDEAHERVVHSEGVIHFEEGGASEETLPIEALKAQCPPPLDGAHYYGLFEKSGIQYGPAFRTMQALYVSPSFALSKLSIAEALKAEFDEFILHPSIIDGALQTVSGLIGNTESAVPYLPFAIDEVEISRATAQSCYVYVEQAGSEQQGSAEIKKFNIRISNEKGLVLVAFKNFCVRAFKFTPAGVTLRS